MSPTLKMRKMFVKKGRTKQQMTPPPVWVTQLDGLFNPVQSQRAPSAAENVIQKEIKNCFAPLVPWTISLTAILTLAPVAFPPPCCDRAIVSFHVLKSALWPTEEYKYLEAPTRQTGVQIVFISHASLKCFHVWINSSLCVYWSSG